MFASLFVVTLGLCYCGAEQNQTDLWHPRLSGPSVAAVKGIAEYECEPPVHWNESVLLKFYKKDNPDMWLGESTSLEGEPGSIFLIIKLNYEGNLVCVASVQNNSDIEPTVSNTIYLRVIEPVEAAEIAVRSGPELFEGQELELLCTLKKGNYVSYKWLQNDRLISQSPGLLLSDNRLLINRTTSEDSGSYKCMATNHVEDEVYVANSSEVVITVKDVVSGLKISFTVLKEDSHNYSAMFTCLSEKGTPPVTFSLYNETEMVASKRTEDRRAIFKVPLVLDQHLGDFHCQADNGYRLVNSSKVPLKVVSVGGPVTIRYDYDIGENFAVVSLKFYCKAAKGSHPRYQWFFNNTLLHDRGTFHYVGHHPPEQSILWLSVGRDSFGTYRCDVSDSFDNTTAISSRPRYLDKEVLNHLPTFVVAIVFGCFTVLILLVLVCCGIGVMYRRRQYAEKPLLDLEMETRIATNEDELDVTEYDEDADEMKADRGDEFDQAPEDSADEWPQLAEWEKAPEDEPVELP